MKKIILLIVGMALTICTYAQTSDIAEQIKAHKNAVFVGIESMRDPFITLAPDGFYYLTFTAQKGDREAVPVYKSVDLVTWTSLGDVHTLKETSFYQDFIDNAKKLDKHLKLWAPEIHFIDNKWVLMYTTSVRMANIMTTKGSTLDTPFTDWGGNTVGHRHDPSLFVDSDGSKWLVYTSHEIIKLKNDLSGFDGKSITVKPSDRKIGHEGAQIIKVEDRYILFGTAWSTDTIGKGTYNLYYCTSDKLTGPYDQRKFVGRCLGHGTVFKDKEGRWWCTAFKNGTYISPEELIRKGISPGQKLSMNQDGLTLVPLHLKVKENGADVYAKDEHYGFPGNDEVQNFEIEE